MNRVTIGQRVQRVSASVNLENPTNEMGKSNVSAWATVVYVHPAGRFHMVEFDGGLRESFAGATE
ncbi:MAG: hypothetical protein LUD69_07460 [Oscillospiraceae bacterium]|nr:hypothetical protein [Oscillospiraceae bacterium]